MLQSGQAQPDHHRYAVARDHRRRSHAINIHQSAEEIDIYIACGDVGGSVITDPAGRIELFVGLGELNDFGYTGVARLGVGDDPNQTEVSVQLVEPDEMR